MAASSAPKPKSKLLMFVIVGGVLSYAAYAILYGDDGSAAKKRTTTTTKPKAKNGSDVFVKADYDAKPTDFAPAKALPKNAFKPLVYKMPGGSATANNPDLGAIHLSDTGGEPWVFSGLPEMDNVKTALLENTKTGENVFLRAGESWKQCKLKSIGPDSIVIIGHDNDEYTVHMQGLMAPPEKAGGAGNAVASVNPVQPPPLTGAIGNGNMNAQAVDPNAAAMAPGMNQNNFNNNGGGRRGRRGRGGGGGNNGGFNGGGDPQLNN